VFLDQQLPHTVLTRDYPEEHNETNDPIYPKNFGEGKYIYNKYKKAINSEKNVLFLGRLATYKYLDMWMAIKQAMVKLEYE
jgi:UDP-galactopyranose mutase